jgi:hypothetical protein
VKSEVLVFAAGVVLIWSTDLANITELHDYHHVNAFIHSFLLSCFPSLLHPKL